MKKLNFALPIMAIAAMLFYVACDDIDLSIEEEKEVENITVDPPPEDTAHIDTTEIDTTIYQRTSGIIPTTGISVSDGVLSFSTFNDFDNTIMALVNRAQEQSDAWATNFPTFTSRYAYYENLESDPSYNDRANNYKRLGEEAFERLVSSLDKIIVEGYLYEYDFANGTYDVTDPNNNTTTYSTEHGAYKTYQYGYCSQRYSAVTTTMSSGKILESWKYCVDYGLYKALGIKSSHYDANDKREAAFQTHFIDRWHHLYYKKIVNTFGSGTYDLTRKKFPTRRARKNHGKTFDSFTIEPGTVKDFKINCFERFHTWTTDFNDDIHNDGFCVTLPCD